MSKVASAERAANEAQIRAIISVPPQRVGPAKAVLIETSLALVLSDKLIPPGRTQLLARIAAVLPDLGGVPDDPIWPVKVAAEAVVEGNACALLMLRLCLLDYYRLRADASFGRWRG